MRPETQKQIVKAFAMMYEDSDMSLSEYIDKLQQLNGQKENISQTKKVWKKVSDEEILGTMSRERGLQSGEIATKLSVSLNRRSLDQRLNSLARKEKVIKEKIHPRLCCWKKV